MSSSLSAHLNRLSGGSLPAAPPPPVITNHSRSHRNEDDRIGRRSRSRSRSRPRRHPSAGRYHSRGRRSRSPSPSYRSNPANSYRRDDEGKVMNSYSMHPNPTQQIPQQQTISVITPKDVPQIIRRILNADDIRIPRRPNEGKKAIFDREELRESIIRRMRSGVEEDMSSGSLPHMEQQVVAIIREPIINRDLSFTSALNLHLPSSVIDSQQISPGPFSGSGGAGGPNLRRNQSISPHSRGMGVLTSRSLERIERQLRERDRERGRRDPRGGGPSYAQRNRTSRSRSRSLDGRRGDRLRRSRSRTPPPMPPDVRRQLEREYDERDLRSSLSRQPKFYGEHDRREAGSSRGRGFRGSRRPFRGRGFPRGSRGGHYERGGRSGFWQHDMYERENQEDTGDNNSNKN